MLNNPNFKVYAFIFIIGFSLSGLSYTMIRNWEEGHNLKEVSYRSQARLSAIKNSLRSMFDANQAAKSLIVNELVTEHNDSLSLQEFQKSIQHLLPKHIAPSMQLIAWLPKVNKAQFQNLSQQVLSESKHELTLKDFAGGVIRDTSPEDEYYPLYFVSFNEVPYLELGTDISSKPSHDEHMQAARGSNETKLDIGSHEKSHHIVSLFLPVFDQTQKDPQLLGFILSQWDIGIILESAVSAFPTSGLDFYLDDERGINIYTQISRSSMLQQPENPDDIVWEESFEIAEHSWQLSSSPTQHFYQSHPIVIAWIALIFGCILTVLAVFYVSLTKVREKLIEQKVTMRTKELNESQTRLEETQRIAHLGGWQWDIPSNTLQWSDEVFRIFGYKPQSFEPTFDFFNQTIHPDDLDHVKEAVDASFQGKDYEIRHRVILPDQSIRYVNEQGHLEFDENNQPSRMIGTVQDISSQYRAERNSQRLSMALAETAESVVITNKAGIVRYVNQAFESISGYKAHEVLGSSPNLIKSGQHTKKYYQLMWEKISGGKTWEGTFINKHKSGSNYKVQQTISPIHDEQRQIIGYVAVQRDITLEEERRSQMEHTQRLESLGILAGGIAHDFNNLLTSIMGNASLAQIKIQANKPLDKHLSNITSASERAADLCRQMLAYSGQGAYQMQWIDFNHLIHEMNELLQVSLKKNTSVVLDMSAPQPWIYADTSQVQQVIMNLVINASEAISETKKTGDIHVTTSNHDMSSKDFEGHFKDGELLPGSYICLSVRDDGPGMDDETKVKIFDPFFTTKFAGRGLGMSAVLGIIQAHKGAMHLETKLGQGTTFTVYFPCSASNPDQEDVQNIEPHHETSLTHEHNSVLLIDDEEYVLETASAMLESVGYRVFTAASAHDGLHIFNQHHSEIDIILLDMTMPEMDGISCVKKLRQIDSQAVILLSSGYTEERISTHVGEVHIDGFLQKPYTSKSLIEKVNTIVDKGS